MGVMMTQDLRLHRWFSIVGTVCMVAIAVGCAADTEPPPADTSVEPDDEPFVPQAAAPCDPGVVRECQVFLNGPNDIHNCFYGLQYCDSEGVWSGCLSETDVEEALDELES